MNDLIPLVEFPETNPDAEARAITSLLSDDEMRALRFLANTRGVSIAALTREALYRAFAVELTQQLLFVAQLQHCSCQSTSPVENAAASVIPN